MDLDYDKLLYPQYIRKFYTISKSTMDNVRKQAKKNIEHLENEHREWEENHAQWEKDMQKFKVDVVEWQKNHPEHPKYSENPEYYNHLGCGTGKEWDKEREKEKSGFMFAPTEPCEPTVHTKVLEHWKRLAYDENYIPDGLEISEED